MTTTATTRASRVLIVEDERQTARLLEFVLNKAGYEVAKAPDGLQALALTRDFLPDAILLDLQLPGLSGLDVLRAARADSQRGDIVVIVLTGSSYEKPASDVLDAGANAHCTKPIAPSTLLKKLHDLGVPPRALAPIVGKEI